MCLCRNQRGSPWHVTLTGPRGNSVELEVAPEVLAKVKVGDHVKAVYTQAVAVSVSRVAE